MLVFSFLFSVFRSELFLFVFAAARHLVNFSLLQVLSTSLLMLLLIFINISMYMYVRIYEYVLYICTLYIYKVFLLLLLLLLLLIVGFSKCSPPKKTELNRRGLTKFAPAKSNFSSL